MVGLSVGGIAVEIVLLLHKLPLHECNTNDLPALTQYLLMALMIFYT